MEFKRRDFLKTAGVLGTAAVYDLFTADLRRLFAQAADGQTHVAWLQGASDSGCTVSLLQGVNPDLVDVITQFRLAIDFHPTIMLPSGEDAMDVLQSMKRGRFPLDVLVIEGAVPRGYNCTLGEQKKGPIPFESWVRSLGKKARYIVAIGTCAAYGGIPAAAPNPTGARGVTQVISPRNVINIPGCPPHPDWIVLTLATVLSGRMPALDRHRRPVAFFDEDLHDDCPFEDDYEDDRFASQFGASGCLYKLGCKGKVTHGDCQRRLWNNKTNACIAGPRQGRTRLYHAGAPCIGCTEPGFPDPPFSPFFVPLAGGNGDHEEEED